MSTATVTNPGLVVSSSPQYHEASSTASIMWTVTAVLLPAAAWGVFSFGFRAALVLAVSIVAAAGTEALLMRGGGRGNLRDGSAILTGLLIGMNVPAGIPVFIPAIASIFAIGVVKWTFGGLGSNWMNPALAGRVFVFFSWTGEMTTWPVPRFYSLDGTTMATVLGAAKTGAGQVPGNGPRQVLEAVGFPRSDMDLAISGWLNENVLESLGIRMPSGYIDSFLGFIPGCIGEVSAVLLLAGAIVLFAHRIITWHTPVALFVTFGLLMFTFGGIPYDAGLFGGDVLFHVLSGGFMLGMLYMSTDMVSSPLTGKGLLIYGAGIGFFTFLIRVFGSFPEGISLAVILMNILVPIINQVTRPRRYGVPARRLRNAD